MEAQDRERLVRIDERTKTIVETLAKHIEQDRVDFKEVHSRINQVSSRQNLFLGGALTLGSLFGIAIAWFRSSTGGT